MRKHRKEPPVQAWQKPPAPDLCPLCGRAIPASQRDAHHLVPKTKGGRVTQFMHRVCHRQIHALHSEAELATRYNTVESLLECEEIRAFVAWVRKKPDAFIERTRASQRLR